MGKQNFQQKTIPWKITLITLIVFLLFLLIWLLIGEIDLLNVQYIVPINGVIWKGKVTEVNCNWIIENFSKYLENPEEIRTKIGLTIAIISHSTIFNPMILLWLFLGIVFSILIVFILRILKIVNYDVLSFSISTAIGCTVFILSHLIINWESDTGQQGIWRNIVRILISAICVSITFIIVNNITAKMLILTKSSNQIINEMKSNKKADDLINKQSKQLFDDYIKQKNKKDITYVDVDEKK